MLGMLVFILGNLCTFAAFNFAAQSLIAPLNSISLVVNVFMASWINHEKWSWRDIVGIVLIMSGSLIILIFSGFTSKDYDLCVLLKLFQKTGTVVFLTITFALITILYIAIVTIEKNLDLKDPVPVEVTDIIEQGKLMAITNNPKKGKLTSPALTIEDNLTTTGDHTKTITLRSQVPILPSSEVDDVIQVAKKSDESSTNSTSDKDSVYSVSLTYQIEDYPNRLQKNRNSSESSNTENRHEILLVENPRKIHILAKYLANSRFGRWYMQLNIIPKFKTGIPLNSIPVKYVLPLAYASLGVFLVLIVGINGNTDCFIC
jgi:hypothetical protein